MMHALVAPDDTIDRIDRNVDPTVETKPGWRWLPYEETAEPSITNPLVSADESLTVEGGKVVRGWQQVTRAATARDVSEERERRLALGFNYDFGDARGVHKIGTTEADLAGWSEVSTYAGALIDSGDTSTTINIVTDTGPCAVTAPEWRAIEISAAAFRQPIWAAGFGLQVTNPIPADYANDSYWT